MDVVEDKPSVVEKPFVAFAARVGSLVAVERRSKT